MDVKRFDRDLSKLTRRITEGEDKDTKQKLQLVKGRLVSLRRENRVKINHSALELLCAKKLIENSYGVEVEHSLSGDLVCDLYGERDETNLIVEIETGFVPPTYALEPATYCSARIASKIARYSSHAEKFSLGTTPTNMLPIPSVFQERPHHRIKEGVIEAKALCDLFYKNPPITLDQIAAARLHSIYVVDLDNVRVQEVSPNSYIQSVSHLPFRQPVT